MNPERQRAIDYLRAPADGIWRWAENGAVVVWRDGSTVAFREEIAQILEWLAPNGLPSFGAIVFLLAACRGKVPTVDDLVVTPTAPLPAKMGQHAAVLLTARNQLRLQLENAITHLNKVSQLPAELNSGIKARCVLAEAVFEPAKAERHVQAGAVLKGMQTPLNDADLLDPDLPSATGSYIRQIHIVAEGLKRHTEESLALRMRTGLDVLPDEIDANLPTAQRAQRLIEELSRDRDVGAVARAARELMAAVRLPRRLGERDQLAIGGVADITNRGPLDRLLLSELAHDDLTLSVRVALNEALYLRREPPMREPPGTLALLLDSGVRLWGIPRVLATSVALALIACDKQHSEVRAWRSHGKDLRPVDLLTRHGLTQHLAALEVEAHPGDAVPAFAEAVASDARNQSVLITHRDSLDDADFRRALSSTPGAPGFVATVDRAGRFELHAVPLARRPPRSEADLNLDAIFDDSKGVSPRRRDIEHSLPAIFALPVFPFLLPVAGTLDNWVEAEDGFTYAIFNDRRLVRLRDARSGARVLATGLPPGKTLWMDWVKGSVHLVKAGAKTRPARLVTVAAQDEGVRVQDILSGSDVLAVYRCGEVILVIRHEDVRAYALSDGRMLGRKVNPHRWLNSRYFHSLDKFYFASWNGSDVQFERITMPSSFNESVIVFAFDRDGSEGPWFVQKDGMVISSATGEREMLPMPRLHPHGIDSIKVSRDGHWMYWCVSTAEWARLKEYKTGNVVEVPPQMGCPKLDRPPPLPCWNLYRVVESITLAPRGLALCGRKNRWRKLTLDLHVRLRIGESPGLEELGPKIPFPSQARSTPHGCFLQTAELPNGAKVFLDSRGLMHFKAADADVPEVSLVLSDTEVAGWTSDGFVCGPQFFFEGERASKPLRVFERLQRILNL